MQLEEDICYRAMRARDGRFDGMFFVAVKTTGVYCRPICPARTPARDRCLFFRRAAQAEQAGFRACFRCRPELAPGSASVDALPRIVGAAVAQIDAGFLNEASIDELAGTLGVTARHLRRAMERELGVSPVELAQTRRLAFAKQLLAETSLPITEIAFASGFSSVRRFNALIRARHGRAPSSLRKSRHAEAGTNAAAITLRLDYRPPLDFEAMLAFLAPRAIPGVERVEHGEYHRTAKIGDRTGSISVTRDRSRRPALTARVSLSLAPHLMNIVARLRALFDLDAEPQVIAEHLSADPRLAPSIARRGLLRVPGAFSAFEACVRAILGQQVTVRGATTLATRFVRDLGTKIDDSDTYTFPEPKPIAATSPDRIAALGMPLARAQTIVELARAIEEGRVDLSGSGAAAPEETIEKLREIPGIGEWTAHYIAMRALRWSNAFVASDLGVKKALGTKSAAAARDRARAWEPWRAYAVMHLWADGG